MSEKSNELQLSKDEMQVSIPKNSAFSNINNFEDAQRMAKAICQSNLVPSAYQNNIPNTMVALEMATRVGISPIFVMQNLDIIQGKPSWRSSFIISALNSCKRFKPLRFKFEGEPKTDSYGCRAYTYDLETNDKIEGPLVNWAMVKAEGWLNKKGSKWQTMPELMFQYRAASFFGRLYAPDILIGMHSVDEIIDSQDVTLEENTEATESQRIMDWIEKADDMDKLEQVKDSLTTSEHIEAYELKYKEISDFVKSKITE